MDIQIEDMAVPVYLHKDKPEKKNKNSKDGRAESCKNWVLDDAIKASELTDL